MILSQQEYDNLIVQERILKRLLLIARERWEKIRSDVAYREILLREQQLRELEETITQHIVKKEERSGYLFY